MLHLFKRSSSVLAAGVAGCFLLSAVILAVADGRHAQGQSPPAKKDAETPATKWTVLFRSDDPSVWDTDSKGKKYAIPLEKAPEKFKYLRLRRMDSGEAQILRLTPDDLQNGTPPNPEVGYWWNGTAKEDWKGRHLGIVKGPRNKFPVPKGMICTMTDGWDAFTGSGFGHKAFVNDGQYYCWRGKEIKKTVFEIAVSDGPLDAVDKADLLPKR